MNTFRLSNVALRDFRAFLFNQGCTRIRTTGGHEIWSNPKNTRTITLQTHKDPVRESVVRSTLNDLGMTRKQFEHIMLKH